MFNFIQFANPGRLWLLLILIPLSMWYFFKIKNYHPTLKISTLQPFDIKPGLKTRLRFLPVALGYIAIISMIIALARPQFVENNEAQFKEGIDIILATDISGSMLARDFKPNRLEAAKEVAQEFIRSRENDRIGLVLFSGQSFTQCPLTSDVATLQTMMGNVKEGMIEDGTAIGLGLANAVARLRNSDAKSKIVILLTDGVNNCGEVAPLTAAQIAASLGIRVYTIGVGRNGMAPYPVQDRFGNIFYQNAEVEIDENTLKKISETTEGMYFRATDNMSLKDVYSEIDKLEKTKLESISSKKTNDGFMPYIVIAGIAMLLNILLKLTVLRQLP